MPALLVWLTSHQAIAGTIAVWFGCTAAGVDLADKAVHFYRDVMPAAVVEKQEAAPESSE